MKATMPTLKVRKDLLILIIFLTLGIGISVFIYKNLLIATQNQIKKTQEELRRVEEEKKMKEMMQAEVQKFKEEQLEIESKTLKFKELIPHMIDTTKVVKMLEDLSQKYEFKEMKVDILQLAEAENSYFTRQFRVFFQGKYQNIVKFLTELQNSQYLFSIEELDIRRNPKVVPYLEATCMISTIQSSSEE